MSVVCMYACVRVCVCVCGRACVLGVPVAQPARGNLVLVDYTKSAKVHVKWIIVVREAERVEALQTAT
jgi:hypothetical protein